MKYLLILLIFILCSGATMAQMSSKSFVPLSNVPAITSPQGIAPGGLKDTGKTASAVRDSFAIKLPTVGLYGIGNTNTETFSNLNSSGKLAGYIRPFKGWVNGVPAFVDVNFGFNVNASNTDSLLANTLLFPDVGKNSFSASVVFNLVFGSDRDHYLISPFFEFANKTIKGRKADSTRNFYTLNTSYGVNLQYLFVEGKDKVSFTVSPYLASVSVPDPGTKNYKYLFTGDEKSPLKTTINSWGIKVTFQYNNFQIFSDFRTVRGNETDIPITGFRGFHPNIGVVLNAEIFEK